MQKKLFKLSIAGFVFVSITGTICHFVYELSGYSKIAALLCPINESSWEHLKLLFFPYLVWSVIEFILLKKDKGVFFSKAAGVISGIIAILVFFYTYTGISGRNIDWLNILSFFIGVLCAFIVDYFMISSGKFNDRIYSIVGIMIFAVMTIMFFLFTFMPPLIPLFRDPINLSYGI